MGIQLLDTAQHVVSYHRFRFCKGLIYSGDIFHINILGQSVIFNSVVLHVPYMVWFI